MTSHLNFVCKFDASRDFEWVKGKYTLETLEGNKYIVPKKVVGTSNKLATYKPDFAHIGEVLMSSDFINKESRVLDFVNEFGLLGLVNYLQIANQGIDMAYNDLAMYHKDIDWLKRFNGDRKPDDKMGYTNFDTETSHKWEMAFGTLKRGTQVSDAQWVDDEGKIEKAGQIVHAKFERTPYAVGRGITNTNKSDIDFWKAYREPLKLYQLAIFRFQQSMSLFISNPSMLPFGYRPAFVPLGKGKMALAIESLIEGVYACSAMKIAQGIEFRPCRAVNEPRYECKECEYGKRYFWVEGKGNALTKEFGVPDCKPHKNINKADSRSGVAQPVPQRGNRKK